MDEQAYLLVKCVPGLSPYEIGRLMSAITLLRGVECTFDASVTGLPADRLRVITGEPTPAAVQRRVRRKVSLGG